MAWTFEITTGNWYDPLGAFVSKGYSGLGPDKNDPKAESKKAHGPIPEGRWYMGPWFDDIGGKGELVCHLVALPGTETYGRTGFMIHGDAKAHPGAASHGCPIADHPTRLILSKSNDHEVDAVAVFKAVEA